MHHLAFMNYFQRPAEKTGDSIAVSNLDQDFSRLVVSDVIETLEPHLVVFCSSKAGYYGKSVVDSHGLKSVCAPHPSSQWWNRKAKKYGGYGRDIIPEFLSNNEFA